MLDSLGLINFSNLLTEVTRACMDYEIDISGIFLIEFYEVVSAAK